MTPKRTILLVDDEPLERGSLSLMLEQEGYLVTTAENGLSAMEQLGKKRFDIVLSDLIMPGMTGMELLNQIKQGNVESEVILITAYGQIKDAVEAIQAGAYGFVEKSQNIDEELKLAIRRGLERLDLTRENRALRMALNDRNDFCQIIGQSRQMREIYDLIDTVAASKASVLIQGESGTGKDLVARAIHQRSPRTGEFVKINCAGLPEHLLESELFGHERGAFTSAYKTKKGRFEIAHDGTIFLDDIDTFPPELQAKLLRVLQDHNFERVGGNETIQVDVRVIASANQDLQDLMAKKLFREDLFYRLNVVPIYIPPLRERPSDIMLLAEHFLRTFSVINNKEITGFSDEALRALQKYNWPGNVRELENVVERAVILERDSHIATERLMLFQSQPVAEQRFSNNENDGSLRDEISCAERDIILATLERNRWRRNKTAEELNINRVTLYKKMKKYGLTDE